MESPVRQELTEKNSVRQAFQESHDRQDRCGRGLLWKWGKTA